MILIQFIVLFSWTATYFSCGELPIAGLSWLGFCGGWGFCCRGGRPPGPPWPWAVGLGCWVVGGPGRVGWTFCDPPCDCCLGSGAGFCCCCCPPGGFWPAEGFCCWETDCCLWVWGEPPWLRGGAPWPGGRVWAEGPWLGLAWEAGSAGPGLAADCWAGAGGWPWGWGRCWVGGLCWGPPAGGKIGHHSYSYTVILLWFWLFQWIQKIRINYPEGRGAVEPVALLAVRQAEEKLLSAKQTDGSENVASVTICTNYAGGSVLIKD